MKITVRFILLMLIFNFFVVKALELRRDHIKSITSSDYQRFEFLESPKLHKYNKIPRQETNTYLC